MVKKGQLWYRTCVSYSGNVSHGEERSVEVQDMCLLFGKCESW